MATMEQRMSRLLQLAERFNCFYLTGLRKNECRPFIVEGHQVGLIRPDIMETLLRYPEIFVMQPDCIELNPAFRDYDERTSRIEKVLRECREKNDFIALKAWREECYDVKGGFSEVPLLKMDRSATCLFGIRNYAVDINGYIKHPELGLCIWLQRRSTTKQTWPGKWDNMIDVGRLNTDWIFRDIQIYKVSGGLSVGYGILETAIKEGYEEASIPRSLMDNLKAAGSVSFYFESERGLFPNTEFVFDLELPLDFVPSNNDGEVDKFELLPVDLAIERILSQDFKTTSAPVVIDFLIRHGFVTPETEPNFPQLVELLHVPLQSLYKRHLPVENGRSS